MKHCSLLIFIALVLAAAGCIEDGFTAAPADAPVPAVDSVRLGTVFTDEPTPTRRFTLRNHASKSVSVTSITLGGDHPEYFRLNVDGFSGREFHDVEIRGKDSIYIFVEATLPPNGRDVPVDISATIDILACGVSRSVVVDAQGRDAERLCATRITADTRFTPGKPYIVYDSLVVAPGATLSLDAGTELYFHDGAYLAVRGTLMTYGTPGQPVHMTGDRTGYVVADISFDIMSRQWTGVFFTSTSRDNVLTGLDMRNTWQGLYVEGPETSLTLVNCRLHNSAGLVLESVHARTEAVGCEFAEGGEGLVRLQGGTATLNHCTLANYYLFSAISGPALQLAHLSADMDDDTSGLPYLQATVANSIIYGLGSDPRHPRPLPAQEPRQGRRQFPQLHLGHRPALPQQPREIRLRLPPRRRVACHRRRRTLAHRPAHLHRRPRHPPRHPPLPRRLRIPARPAAGKMTRARNVRVMFLSATNL